MYRELSGLYDEVKADWQQWPSGTVAWFRGESDDQRPSLLPRMAGYSADEENFLLQTFRRQAGGLGNTPPRKETDKWLFLAQHYGIPTRLLDWTESFLAAVYFAVNHDKTPPPRPRVFMLNPHALNHLTTGKTGDWLAEDIKRFVDWRKAEQGGQAGSGA